MFLCCLFVLFVFQLIGRGLTISLYIVVTTFSSAVVELCGAGGLGEGTRRRTRRREEEGKRKKEGGRRKEGGGDRDGERKIAINVFPVGIERTYIHIYIYIYIYTHTCQLTEHISTHRAQASPDPP